MSDNSYGSLSHWLGMLVGCSIVVLGAKHYMPEVYWILDFIRSYPPSHFFLVCMYVMIPVSITYSIVILSHRLAIRLADILFNGRRWGSL